MPKPTFSLILCTIGRTEPLQRLFTSLSNQTLKDFEVIIVDQNAVGVLDAILKANAGNLTIKNVTSKPGLSRARNIGLSHVTGQFIAFPDDDCWYPETLLETVRALFDKHPELDLITGVTRDAAGDLSNGKFLGHDALLSRLNIWRAGNSNGVFVRAAALTAEDGFNETLGVGAGTPFGAGEETDFMLRLLTKGKKGRFFASLYVHHDQVDAVINESTLTRAKAYAMGFGRTLRLNNFPAHYALFRAAKGALGAAYYLITGNWPLCRLKWIWANGTMAGYLSRFQVSKTTTQ